MKSRKKWIVLSVFILGLIWLKVDYILAPPSPLYELIGNSGDVSPDSRTIRIGFHTKKYTKISEWMEQDQYQLMWHPDYLVATKNASGYTFSSIYRKPVSVPVQDGIIHTNIKRGSILSSAGFMINADSSKSTRPAVVGQYWVTKYRVEESSIFGSKTYEETIPWMKQEWIEAVAVE